MKAILLVLLFLQLASSFNLQPSLKKATAFCVGICGLAPLAFGATTLNGAIKITNGFSSPLGNEVALYVTVRPDVGVFQSAILNNKPPPVLTKRIEKISPSSFPYQFTISSDADSTPEGVASYAKWSSGKTPLLISARVDEDGYAATRGPNDLVGKGKSSYDKASASWSKASIELVGRGVAGKFITGNGQAPNIPSSPSELLNLK